MKRDRLIWIFCIVILLSLTVKVSFDSSKVDCDKCLVDLTSTLSSGGAQYTHRNISIIKLIEAQKRGECLFIWDPVQGYINNGYR